MFKSKSLKLYELTGQKSKLLEDIYEYKDDNCKDIVILEEITNKQFKIYERCKYNINTEEEYNIVEFIASFLMIDQYKPYHYINFNNINKIDFNKLNQQHFIIPEYIKNNTSELNEIIKEDNINLLKQYKNTKLIWNNACKIGNLDIIKWLHKNRNEGCTNYVMNYAAENGHLDIIKWLHENRNEDCTNYEMNYAA